VIYRVRHVTRYDYRTPVDLGVHLAHLRPRRLPGQQVLQAEVRAAPAVSWRHEGRDHFGNDVTWLSLDAAHAAFEVTAESTVDVLFREAPEPSATPGWEMVAHVAANGGPDGWQAAEFVFDSPLAQAGAEARAYAAPSFAPARPNLAALLELNARIHSDFTFRPGVTTTSTPIRDVMRRREGVCQDFAHVMISMLRSFGIPARYVSGYIRTRPSPGHKRRLGADQSHAWVGAWLGSEHGWLDLDPTNGIVVRDEHVVLGWGRDYSDVTPLRGVILGGGEQSLAVRVELDALTDDGVSTDQTQEIDGADVR
jgi:transglutaminase-like putative cysteine protease